MEGRPRLLLLTTALPLEKDAAASLRVLESVHAGGGSALVVKLGPDLGELPRRMAAEADRLKLPLFTIGPDVFWSDLMEPLLERIINAEHWRLKRSLEIHGRFTELVLDGKGVNEICRTLAELLDSAVSVEDASFHLLKTVCSRLYVMKRGVITGEHELRDMTSPEQLVATYLKGED